MVHIARQICNHVFCPEPSSRCCFVYFRRAIVIDICDGCYESVLDLCCTLNNVADCIAKFNLPDPTFNWTLGEISYLEDLTMPRVLMKYYISLIENLDIMMSGEWSDRVFIEEYLVSSKLNFDLLSRYC